MSESLKGGWEANLYKRRQRLQAKGEGKRKKGKRVHGKSEGQGPFLSREQNLRENDVQNRSRSSREGAVKSGGCNGRSEALSQWIELVVNATRSTATSGQMDDFITFSLPFYYY